MRIIGCIKCQTGETVMGFTVTRPGGTKDAEFQAYARLLRQKGVDLGKLPRVPEPGTNRRWLYVWNSQADAQAFANELKEHSGDPGWQVVQVNGPPSVGPLGPVLIQMVRQAEGLTFRLHPLSRAMIRSAFPDAVSPTTYASIDPSNWDDFRKKKGGLADLVRELAPNLTGLMPEQLAALGYAVVDADTDETLVFVPPAIRVRG
jgi:hypothetical protein